MRHIRRCLPVVAALLALPAAAAPPVFHTAACSVTVNGTRIGTDLTSGGSSLRNTFAYDPATKLYNFWGFMTDDANFPSAASSLRGVGHATSTDGVHYTSDRNLSYAFGSADYHSFGATIDPPLDFFRAVFDTATGTWKLFNWTENDQVSNPSFGKYNYNTSVNDLGTLASTTEVLHQGPLNSPYSGNHVGAFGLVDNMLYLRVDSATGGDAQFAYNDSASPPSTGALLGEANLFTGTPYCWGLDPSCPPATNPNAAYVHNVGRTLRQLDGSLGTYYTFRHWDGTRTDKQVYYVESGDNGATWSAPAGVFANGSLVTVDGAPLDSANGTANFSGIDVITTPGSKYRSYFSTQDAAGNYVMASTLGSASDSIFFDSFDPCD